MPSPNDAIARLFQRALALHRSGRLVQAEAGYRQVLALDPRHADSLNFLGVAAAQSGRNEAAVELIGQAIRQRGSVADYHDNLGLALLALGRLDEAGNCHRKALRLDPKHASAHNHFANILARPLCAMAHELTASLAPNGRAILAGLLNTQVNWVVSAHRRAGLVLEHKITDGAWSILTLRKL